MEPTIGLFADSSVSRKTFITEMALLFNNSLFSLFEHPGDGDISCSFSQVGMWGELCVYWLLDLHLGLSML